jgi:GMP synthase (glutamine-hydrolysing)
MLRAMRPVILMTGHTYPELQARRGDFDDWFARDAGWPKERFAIVEAAVDPLPDPRGVDGVIVSGSAAAVHDREPWSVRAGEWLVAAASAGVPILGVCYGHQLLADALGGATGRNPRGRETGVVRVEVLEDDPLFEGLPRELPVVAAHRDIVTAAPPGARVLAANANTAVQAMAIGENVRTVQFHPEFDAETARYHVTAMRAEIDRDHGPGAAEDLLAAIPAVVASGPRILANFFRYWLR